MVFRYTLLGAGSRSDGRTSRNRLRWCLLLAPPIFLSTIIFHAVFWKSDSYKTWYQKSSTAQDANVGYVPGRLGRQLLSRHRDVIGSSSTEDWEILLADPATMAGEMFDIMSGRDEDKCQGWEPKKLEGMPLESRRNWDECWRARMYDQIEKWDMKDAE